MPKVSVIVPVHNAARYLHQSLDSILAQTLPDIEVICVENGSSDNSLQILNDYKAKDSRLQLIVQTESRGAGHARNDGMSRATGKYLSFLDADDYFKLTMLEELADEAEKSSADVVICNNYIFDDKTGVISEPATTLEERFLPSCYVFSYKDIPDSIFQLTSGAAWRFLLRNDFVARCNLQFQVIRNANDVLFSSMALIKAERIAVLRKRLVYYRVNNADSLSDTLTTCPDAVYYSASELRNRLNEDGVYAKVKRSYVNKCISSLMWSLDQLNEWNAFKRLWNNMREMYFHELDIANHKKEYFHHAHYHEWCEQITQKSPEEWVYGEFLSYKKALTIKTVFPYDLIPMGSRIVLCGAGTIGKDYYTQLIYSRYCQVVLWVDKKWENIGLPVQDISKVVGVTYDETLIAVFSKDVASEIKEELLRLGVCEEKIVLPFSES